MKFFSKFFMTDEHIKALKESRKVYASDKIIKHGNNYVEVINYEKRIKVYPKRDELLDMINSIERFDAEWNCFMHQDWNEYRNYRYEDLPKKLRNYMQQMDAYFFEIWLNKHKFKSDLDRYDELETRLLITKGEITDEDFEKYVLLGQPIPSTLGKKAKDSARRSYKMFSNYVRTNIHRFTTFVTLTFANEENKDKYERLNFERLEGEKELKFNYVKSDDFETAKNALKNMMDNLRKKLKSSGHEFYYLTVWELQKNGNYHFHILCSDLPKEELYKVPKWLDFNFVKNEFNNGFGLSQWNYGKSDVQKIKSPDRVTTYVSKYIIKSFLNVDENSYLEYLNKKKYFPSKNLDLPKIDYFIKSDEDFENNLKELNLENIKPFEREYLNPYNESKILNKTYTIMKKESSRPKILT